MKTFIKIVITILIMSTIGFGLIQTCKINQKYQMSKWNNGICNKCNIGNMIFTSATCSRYNDKEYYYTCDNCGHTVVFSQIMK